MKRFIKSLMALLIVFSILLEPMPVFAGYDFASAFGQIGGNGVGSGPFREGVVYGKYFVEVQICRIPMAGIKNTTEAHDLAKIFTAYAPGGITWHDPYNSNMYGSGDPYDRLEECNNTKSLVLCTSNSVVDSNGKKYNNYGLSNARSMAWNLVFTNQGSQGNADPNLVLQWAKLLNQKGSSYCPAEYIEDLEAIVAGQPVEEMLYCYFIAYEVYCVPCWGMEGGYMSILVNGADASDPLRALGDWDTLDWSQAYSGITWDYPNSVIAGRDNKVHAQNVYNVMVNGVDTWLGDTRFGTSGEINKDTWLKLWEVMFIPNNWSGGEYGSYFENYVEATEIIHGSIEQGGSSSNANMLACGYFGCFGEDIPIKSEYHIQWSIESKTIGEGADFSDGMDNWGKVYVHFRPANSQTLENIKNSKTGKFKLRLSANYGSLRMPLVSNDYWAGRGGNITGSDTFYNVQVTEATDTVEFEVTALGMARLLEGGRHLIQDWACPDSVKTYESSSEIKSEHRVTWRLEIISVTGDIGNVDWTVSAGSGKGIGNEDWDWNKADNGWRAGGSTGSNILSWVQKLTDDIPWHFNSSSGGAAYAEIMANEVGNLAQDWSVMGGLPSTENLAVAVGGTCFAVDAAGYITSAGMINKSDKTVSRDIKFVINIHDMWGSETSGNPECTLSCPGHSYTVYGNKQNGTSVGCNGSWTCPVCGYTDNVGTSNCNENDHSGCNHIEDCAAEDHAACGHGCNPKCDKSHTNTHNCSKHDAATINYNCSTGTWTGSGEVTSLSSTKTLVNGQRYDSTVTWTSQYGDKTGTVTHSNGTVLCEGYTSKYGCVSSHKTNCVHRMTDSNVFHVREYLDYYAWRTITNAKVYMLTHASITSINTNLLENSALGQSSTNANLVTDMWRGNGAWVNGQKGQNGRLWFTQFKNPTPSFGSGAHTVSVQGYDINNSLCSTYWLSDCIITIDTYADSVIGNDMNVEVIDDVTISQYAGRDNNHYSSTVESTVTTFKQNKGDWLDSTASVRLSAQLANAWMFKNQSEDYTVNVISDTLFVGIEGGVGGSSVAQDVVADVYAVDDGINIFERPFSGTGNSEEREYYHKSKYSDPKSIFQSNESNFSKIMTSKQPFMFQGYLGSPAQNAVDKYGITGNNVALSSALCYAVSKSPSSLTRFETKMGVDFSAGSIQSGGGTTGYTRVVSDSSTDKAGRRGIIKLQTTGSSSNEKFTGHYREHSYPYKGSYSVAAVSTESGNSYNSGTIANCTNNGAGAIGAYNVALHMSNLNIKDYIANGVYTQPVGVTVYFKKVYEMNNDPTQASKLPERNTAYNASYSSSYTNSAGASGVVNDVVIHDPVSVQYDQLISNNYGGLGGIYSIDESQEDLRITSEGVLNANRKDYIVVGNKFYIWSSDLGDFRKNVGWEVNYASGTPGVGSGALGSNVQTGAINSSGRGYTDKMNTASWVQQRTVTFGFPVSYINTSGTKVLAESGTVIDLSTVKTAYTGYGNNLNSNLEGFRNSASDVQDLEFVYGRMYEFYCIESAAEGTGYIKFDTYAKNNKDNVVDTDINDGRFPYAAAHVATKTIYTDIVGRIGNLAIEDTSDFRYSNLFKVSDDSSWLIDGVVKNVFSDEPNNIVSTTFNIMGERASQVRHATYSITNYDGGGKAGNFCLLPLHSGLNNLNEFKGQELRLGYSVFMDLETIGQYHGYNYIQHSNGTFTNDKGPQSSDDSTDNRNSKIVIKPKYMLYDYDTGQFYNIDMYCGNIGSYSQFYDSDGSIIRNSTASLFVDLEEERERRNVSAAEYVVTRAVTSQHGAYMVRDALTEKDYIGTASEIVLDSYNRTYIGSSIMNGETSGGTYAYKDGEITTAKNGKQLSSSSVFKSNSGDISSKLTDLAFANAVQRYHFTMGLPSSTVITYPNIGNSQTAIVDSNNKIKAEHPNSVIVCFADIKAYGDVYTLHYDVKQIMESTTITIGTKVLDYVAVSNGALTKYDVPLFVCDPWYSSTDDLDIYGTH